MKLPYLRFISHRGKIKIYLIDGGFVRTQLDEEFTNFGQHFRFKCIPEFEFWIEKEAVPDERRFYIDHLLVEWKLMSQGVPYEKAITTADLVEQSQRSRSRDFSKMIKNEMPDPARAHLKLLATTAKNVDIWLVDGRLVRSVFFIDYTEGGHEYVYNFIPKNEVWLDNDISVSERPYILLHELHEQDLMSRGMTYPPAHRRSSRLEWSCRHNPQRLTRELARFGIDPKTLL